ncbi:M15 family metallopeptidase [Herbivorax sp. ANBcel31]|uniref:M15 family metallopeptidase n=1 Tax=Herbivorax sp. ANBcel31 TaxID=3069754 RepID=UPI0027B71D73|nr:M15 family metallopeptidase [Herbivorax sp. ANBcel31]MDQ2086307.1 M15 family metallopeptidase [Herbivorax sp. ANBcel31]
MYKRKSNLRKKRRLMFAKIRTLVIFMFIAWGLISFTQNSGETNDEDIAASSQIDKVEVLDNDDREDYKEIHNEDLVEEDTQDERGDSEGIQGEGNSNEDTQDERGDSEDTQGEGDSSEDTQEVNIDDWRLLLVNADNPVPDDYTFELSSIDGTRKFDSRAIDELKMLIEDCRRETGDTIWAQSTYRDKNEQKVIFDRKVQEYIDLGKSIEEADRLAATSISRPGTSEHHIGLAVDFNYAKTNFENTAAFKWLNENAHKYGFILRYPEDKQSITKVVYEPWHFRYVGKEHAEVIKSKGFCLEEYIEYLKEGRED